MIKKIFKVAVFKTLFINLKYFGFKGLKLPIVLAHGVQIKNAKGKIIIDNFKAGALKMGFSSLGTRNDRITRGCWDVSGTLLLHDDVYLSKGCSIGIGKEGVFETGKLIVTGDTSFICQERITIGDDVLVSWGGYIMDTDFHHIYIDDQIINEPKSITIGNHVWIGMNVSVLKGSEIPDGCVVGAGSIVTKKLENKNSVYINNKVIKEHIVWKP